MGRWLTGATPDPEWLTDPIGFMLAPVTSRAFFDHYFEQGHLHAKHGDPVRFADLLTIDAVDAFIDGADLRHDMVELVRHAERVDPSLYLNADGQVIASAVAEQYLHGATIVLPQLNESMPRLGVFRRALELKLSCHVQTNAYLTPPGQQGFAPHYDNHDVFVLQLSGTKHWRVYENNFENPYRGEGFAGGGREPGEIVESLILRPGDCLYLPRGMMHDAANAGDEPSLHLSVGLVARTWADLMLEAVSALAVTEPAFRRSLPPGYADPDFDRTTVRARFRDLARLIGEKAAMDDALDHIAHAFLRARRPEISGLLSADGQAPAVHDRFRRRALVPFRLVDGDDRIILIGPGGDLHFGTGDRAALDRALSGTPFGRADLPVAADPGYIIRRLWANGYLERIVEP